MAHNISKSIAFTRKPTKNRFFLITTSKEKPHLLKEICTQVLKKNISYGTPNLLFHASRSSDKKCFAFGLIEPFYQYDFIKETKKKF